MIEKLYEQLPDQVRETISLAFIVRYVLEGDPPFLPRNLSKIRKDKTRAGHDIAITLHALRILAFEHECKSEEQLEKCWQEEMNKKEVQSLTPFERIKLYLFRKKK